MATVQLTEDTFESTIAEHGIVLVDFWAEWCPPCRKFGPIFESASEAHPDLVFGKVDTDAEQGLATQAEITSIPTLMIFRDKVQLYSQPGALPAAELERLITTVRALDMDEVRRELAESTKE